VEEDPTPWVRDGWVTVAVEQRVCGVLAALPRPDHRLVENLAVHPRFQRHGVGSRLRALAEARARALGRPEVRLYTNARMIENLRYYAHRGYRVLGQGMHDGYSRVFLSKRVDAR
jgi:GNAT superfamily N-acetyltransferase